MSNIEDIKAALNIAHNGNNNRSKEAIEFLGKFKKSAKPNSLFDVAKALTGSVRQLHYSSQLCKRIVEIVDDENALASVRDFALNVVLKFSNPSQRNARNFFHVIVSWIAIKSSEWKPQMVCAYVNSILTKDTYNIRGMCSLLEFLKTLPEELGNRGTNHLVTKKRKKLISDTFRSEVRQYINQLEVQIKRFPQNEEIQNLAFEAATSWIEFASLRNVAQVLLYLNCPLLSFASRRLTSSSAKLLTCMLNMYTEKCNGLARVCRKAPQNKKVSFDIGDFQTLDRRIEELGRPIMSATMTGSRTDEFMFSAVEVLVSLSKAGLSRVAFSQQAPLQRSFTVHTLVPCILKYTSSLSDFDTIRDVILPFWASGSSRLNSPPLVEIWKMGALRVLNRGVYPAEAMRWDVRCAVSGEEWFERRNDLRACFIQISKALFERGHKECLCEILKRSTNELVVVASKSSKDMNWIYWESAVWRARCIAHTIPNLSGQHLSSILAMYFSKNGPDSIIHMHSLLRATFVDGIRLTRTFWTTHKDTMPYALKLSIVGISAISNMNDETIAKCDIAWFRGEHLNIMRTALVQSASTSGITFDRLCQSAAQSEHPLNVSLFSELLNVMSKIVYRSNTADGDGGKVKIPVYALPAHIRRPVLKGLSALGSALGNIKESERSLNVLTLDSWRTLDILTSSLNMSNWSLQLLRALSVLEAVLCGDVASMWNRRSSDICVRFVSKHWILVRRVFTVLRSSRNTIKDLSPLLARLGTSLLRCADNTNLAPKVAKEFLEFTLSMYVNVADETLLNCATDVVVLMGSSIVHLLPPIVEAVFPSTSAHMKRGGGPDGVPEICTSFFKFLNVVCRVCGEATFETNVFAMANAIMNASVSVLQQQPQHRDASSAVLELVQTTLQVISNARSKQGCLLGVAFFKSLSSSDMGASLVKALLVAARGAMPSWMIVPVSRTLHSVLASCPNHFTQWFVAAAVSPSISQERALNMASQLHACGTDRSRFKRILKSLSGGKKRGTEGSPSSNTKGASTSK